MELEEAEALVAVAEQGSLGAAAERLGFVPSRMSARFGAWEARLGRSLLERHRRGARLTALGEALLPLARELLALRGRAEALGRGGPTEGGPLRLGSMESTAAIRLPQLLPAWQAAHPSLRLDLRTGPTAELVRAVLEGELDAAWVAGPVAHPALAHAVLWEEALVWWAPEGWGPPASWPGQGQVAIAAFKAGCSYRRRMEQELLHLGMPESRVLELGSLEGILGLAAGGQVAALLPQAVLPEGRKGLRAWTLPEARGQAPTWQVWRRAAPLRSECAGLLGLVREAVH